MPLDSLTAGGQNKNCLPAVTMDNNGEGYVSLYHLFFPWPVMFV